MLNTLRNTVVLDKFTREEKTIKGYIGNELSRKVVGIVGGGQIATHFAKKLKVFGANILTYNLFRDKELEEIAIYTTLDTLLKVSDIVILHCSLIDKTIGLIRRVYYINKRRYGYRKVTIELKNNYKVDINHKNVLRIMKESNPLDLRKKKSKYNSYKGEVGKAGNNLLERDFNANKYYEKVCTDVNEFNNIDELVKEVNDYIQYYNEELISLKLKRMTPSQYLKSFHLTN